MCSSAAMSEFARPRAIVELRKMTDTRSGFWLLLSTAALTVLTAVVSCLVFPDDESNLFNFLVITVQPASILMETLNAMQWARVGTSLALWLLLPIVLGFWRVARSDVR
jgi:hypothetical protein